MDRTQDQLRGASSAGPRVWPLSWGLRGWSWKDSMGFIRGRSSLVAVGREIGGRWSGRRWPPMRRDPGDECEVDGRTAGPPGGEDSPGGYSFAAVSLGDGGGLASWARGLTAWASSCPLPLSASVRLPASTVKLGEKLERYHTAVQVGRALAGAGEPAGARGGPCISPCVPCSQRSESVKSPGSPRTELFVAPVGVASKRHLFEKELVGQSRVEPASSRKVRAQVGGSEVSNLGPVRLCQFGQNPPSTRVSVCVLSLSHHGSWGRGLALQAYVAWAGWTASEVLSWTGGPEP